MAHCLRICLAGAVLCALAPRPMPKSALSLAQRKEAVVAETLRPDLSAPQREAFLARAAQANALTEIAFDNHDLPCLTLFTAREPQCRAEFSQSDGALQLFFANTINLLDSEMLLANPLSSVRAIQVAHAATTASPTALPSPLNWRSPVPQNPKRSWGMTLDLYPLDRGLPHRKRLARQSRHPADPATAAYPYTSQSPGLPRS